MQTIPITIRNALRMLLIACMLSPIFNCGDNPIREATFFSEEFIVDDRYASMQGPIQRVDFQLPSPTEEPELIWLTGFESSVVDPYENRVSQSFMCHTNLVYNGLPFHRRMLGEHSMLDRTKIFTISQGEYGAILPEGFGIPVVANTVAGNSFTVFNQLLNMNYQDFREKPLSLRYRNTVYYVRESERVDAIEPLYPALAQIMATVNAEQAIFNVHNPSALQEEATCSRGAPASSVFADENNQQFTYHWKLPPGREVRRTLITEAMLDLREETTIHHIVAHMHPYAVSLSLIDLTEYRVLFRSDMTNHADHVGLQNVEHYSSAEGIPVYPDHMYALESVYNNTSQEEHDAMAIMYLFLKDKRFELDHVPDALL